MVFNLTNIFQIGWNHQPDNDDTKHVSFVLSCPYIVAPHVLGLWAISSKGIIFFVVSNICSINFSAIGKQKFMLHFFTAILRITFMASRILKNLFVNQFCWGRWVNLWMTVARIVVNGYYLRFGAAAMAVATLAEGCFNYVLRPCFNAVSYAAWLEWCVFQKWVLDGWMNGFSVSWFFFAKGSFGRYGFIGLERNLLKEGHWSSWCCTFYMNYWSWDSLVASFLLDFFGGFRFAKPANQQRFHLDPWHQPLPNNHWFDKQALSEHQPDVRSCTKHWERCPFFEA